MAQLQGTEKQVTWANDIRESAMASLNQKRDQMATMVTRHEARGTAVQTIEPYRKLVADLDEAKALLSNESSAEWWIGHRGSLGYLVMQVLRRDLPIGI